MLSESRDDLLLGGQYVLNVLPVRCKIYTAKSNREEYTSVTSCYSTQFPSGAEQVNRHLGLHYYRTATCGKVGTVVVNAYGNSISVMARTHSALRSATSRGDRRRAA
jgi:hypothetical protein